MAKSDAAQLSTVPSADSTSRSGNLNIAAKSTVAGNENESKEGEITALPVLDEGAAIPKGTIDPVYEAKARVLNHAVSYIHESPLSRVNTR